MNPIHGTREADMSAQIPRFIHAITAEHIQRSSGGAVDWRYYEDQARLARAQVVGTGLRRLRRAVRGLWQGRLVPAMVERRMASTTRKALRNLDEATLRDIGVAPDGIESAARTAGRQARAAMRRGTPAPETRGWRQRPGSRRRRHAPTFDTA